MAETIRAWLRRKGVLATGEQMALVTWYIEWRMGRGATRAEARADVHTLWDLSRTLTKSDVDATHDLVAAIAVIRARKGRVVSRPV